MSTTINRILGRPPTELPDDLTSLTERQIDRALETREHRLREIASAKGLTREERTAALEEARTTAADVQRLRAAVGTGKREATTSPSEETAWLVRTAAARAGVTEERRTDGENALRALIRDFALPSELAGTRFDPERLTPEEGSELLALTRRAFGTRGPALDAEGRARIEELLETAAGEPVFRNARIERELDDWLEQERRAKLPTRAATAEPGSVTIPAAYFDALRSAKGEHRGGTAPDLAALAVIVNALDLRDAALIQNGRIEEDEDGEPVLIVKAQVRLVSGANPPMDAVGGPGRITPDVDGLGAAGWLDVRRAGNRIEIRRGSTLP